MYNETRVWSSISEELECAFNRAYRSRYARGFQPKHWNRKKNHVLALADDTGRIVAIPEIRYTSRNRIIVDRPALVENPLRLLR